MEPQKRRPRGSTNDREFASTSNHESTTELDGESLTDGNSSWPAAREEESFWTPDVNIPHSNRERRQQTGPYLRTIPAFITHAELNVPASLAAEIEEASNEIVRFDAEFGSVVGPYGSVLLRTEAVSSSRIEQLSASARAIATVEAGAGKSGGNAEVIVANARAMQSAIAAAGSLDEASILETHRILMEEDQPSIAGKWRVEQNWIGPGAAGPRLASFVPPAHERVPALMKDLVAFIQRTDVPVIALVALAHAQFETVHPFIDGNGRTGRTLMHALLRDRGLTTESTVPISAGILSNTDDYFSALTQYRFGNTDDIVSLTARSTIHAVGLGRQLVGDLQTIREGWNDLLKARKGAVAWRLADMLISQPVVTRELIALRLEVGENNVDRVLQPFEDAGILVKSGSADRGRRVWRSVEVLNALDAFGERLGRRTLARSD
jgi:Fic family protein